MLCSDLSLLTSLFAANIVATPAESRGSAFNDDGTPFVLAVNSDSLEALPKDASSLSVAASEASHPLILTALPHKRLWVRVVCISHDKNNPSRERRITQERFLRAGRMASWQAEKGFVVSVGFRGGAEFALNGEPVRALNAAKAVLKNVAVQPEMMRERRNVALQVKR